MILLTTLAPIVREVCVSSKGHMLINVVARKPHGQTGELFVVVDREPIRARVSENGRYVSATANPVDLARGEWFWGHYFDTLSAAMAHFNAR